MPMLLLAALGAGGCKAPGTSDQPVQQARDKQPIEHGAVLVRGWIGDAAADLEPVIPTAAPPSFTDAGAGPYLLRGLGDGGELLFELRFGEASLASIPGRPGHHFMLVAPVGAGGSLALASIELDAANGRKAARQARWPAEALLDGLQRVQLAVRDDGAVGLQWDAESFELLQLRDSVSGAILALDRDGDVAVQIAGGELDVALSDGVRSAAALFRVPRP